VLQPIQKISANDVDGDGDMDVVASATNTKVIVWFENDGAQNFTPHTLASGVDITQAMDVSDIDSDGDVDVITADIHSQIHWFINDGSPTGGWGSIVIPSAMASTGDIHAADLDRDGDVDLVAANSSNPDFGWYENNGAETFTFHALPGTINTGRDVSVADLEGDGDLDVLFASFAEDWIL